MDDGGCRGWMMNSSVLLSSQSLLLLQVIAFQLCRAIAFLHTSNICHRDVKPNNLLVNAETGLVKICDLGSMKKLEPGAPNVSYICSRFFRAPELLLGAEHYSCAIGLSASYCCWLLLIL